MTEKKSSWKPTSIQKAVILAVAAVLFYTLGGFFLLPPLVKHLAVKNITRALHRQTAINQVKINPYLLTCTIDEFKIQKQASTDAWITCDQLFVNLQAVSLFKLALVVKELQVVNPTVSITRNEDRSYNFSDLLISPPKDAAEKTGKPLRFSLNNISISGGQIQFIDTPRQTRHRVTDLTLGLPLISNLPYHLETHVQPSLAARVNGTPVSLQGTTKPFADTLETSFNIDIDHLDLPFYLAYIPGERNFTVKQGSLSSKLTLAYAQPPTDAAYLKLAGELEFENLAITDNDDHQFLSLPRLIFTFAPANLLAREVHIASMTIEEPRTVIHRLADGSFKLPSLVLPATGTDENPADQPQEKPFLLTVDQLGMNGGVVDFLDQMPTPNFTARLAPIELAVANFTTNPDHQGTFTGSLHSDGGESLAFDGSFSVTPLILTTHVAIQSIPLPRYRPYYQEMFTGILEQGMISTAADLKLVAQEPGKTMRLDKISATLEGLTLRETKKTGRIIDLPLFRIEGTSIDLLSQEVVIGSLVSEGGTVNLQRRPDGRLNLQELLPSPATAEKKTDPEATEKQAKPWKVDLADGKLSGFTIVIDDRVPAAAVTTTIDNITLDLGQLTTRKNQTGSLALALRLNKSGTFKARGTFGINPLQADLTCQADRITLKPLQGYVNDVVDLVITDGRAGSKGILKLTSGPQQDIAVTFKGQAAISNFASVDSLKAGNFVSWRVLEITGINAASQPRTLQIGNISLKDSHTDLVVNPDGRLNLQAMMVVPQESKAEKPSETETTTAENPAMALTVGGIQVANGRFSFQDRSLTPSYSMVMDELNGSVSQISSTIEKPAEILFNGRLNGDSPLEITGTVHPLLADLFADLNVSFTGIDMSPFTPYSGKFIGYTIGKGKFTLQTHSLVENRKLTVDNDIFLDQLTFGDPVDSPDAMNLPVKLAVALLQNRQGEIRLKLPIRGDFDDPKFSVGGIVFKVIFNLIAKAVTSPFALLGAAFGGGEEVNLISFAAGSVLIDQENQQKLTTVGKALYDRPGLKLEILGQADPASDPQGLAELQFQRLLKTKKLKAMTKKGIAVPAVDDLIIETAEYEEYLKKAYKEAPFEKPKNVIGLLKKQPAAEMERMLREHLVIARDDLRQLAYQRAEAVKNFLAGTGPVEQERMFLAEPKIPASTAEGDSAGAREVTLTIK
ncbi:MAG: DUF748 domain-containing protein [Deltaproteobacteria bacterium]|nr:DUF748 domain-containing protein [Candidatus Anaeroferrophillus wilburensis]MBN2889387.1 DUF748 domain-containing protein [Deltaproteobacteria bacterium]